MNHADLMLPLGSVAGHEMEFSVDFEPRMPNQDGVDKHQAPSLDFSAISELLRYHQIHFRKKSALEIENGETD